jgi:hypothetical protein
MTDDYLENQFTSHDLHNESQELWVKARVEAVLKTSDNYSPEK